jgi:bifunctional non-homologous end joining protein LigD
MLENGKKIAHYIRPMLATAVDKPFSDKDWLFELKLDGYRAIADLRGKGLLLYSRNGLSLSAKYPSIAGALRKIKAQVVMDGEIVLLNENNKPDFQKLQNYRSNGHHPLVYYVFDLLYIGDESLLNLPLVERKKLLKKLVKRSGTIRYSDHIEENGLDFFKTVKADDLEGVIAKKKDSLYTPGIRTREWLKIKYHKTQEAVIAGYTEPKGSRQHFGSLLLGQYDNGKLRYIGNVGTGFTEKSLKELWQKMQRLVTNESPFEANIKINSWATWIKPVLVAEVAYGEITRDGILRHPVFKGLREDKQSRMIKTATERSQPVKKIVRSLK